MFSESIGNKLCFMNKKGIQLILEIHSLTVICGDEARFNFAGLMVHAGNLSKKQAIAAEKLGLALANPD